MITRRTGGGGATGLAAAATTGVEVSVSAAAATSALSVLCAPSPVWVISDAEVTLVADSDLAIGAAFVSATGVATGAAAIAVAGVVDGAIGVESAVGLTATGAVGTDEAIAGFPSPATTFPAGGAATTGPIGGLAAIAGTGAMMRGSCRGWGTIFRGAGLDGSGEGATWTGATGLGGAGVTATTTAALGFGAVTTARRFSRSAATSSFRLWIALSTSPGLDTRDQSIFGFGSLSTLCGLADALRPAR